MLYDTNCKLQIESLDKTEGVTFTPGLWNSGNLHEIMNDRLHRSLFHANYRVHTILAMGSGQQMESVCAVSRSDMYSKHIDITLVYGYQKDSNFEIQQN